MTLFDIAKKQNQFASFLTFTNHLDLEEEIYLLFCKESGELKGYSLVKKDDFLIRGKRVERRNLGWTLIETGYEVKESMRLLLKESFPGTHQNSA
jgi:hypothetical protein